MTKKAMFKKIILCCMLGGIMLNSTPLCSAVKIYMDGRTPKRKIRKTISECRNVSQYEIDKILAQQIMKKPQFDQAINDMEHRLEGLLGYKIKSEDVCNIAHYLGYKYSIRIDREVYRRKRMPLFWLQNDVLGRLSDSQFNTEVVNAFSVLKNLEAEKIDKISIKDFMARMEKLAPFQTSATNQTSTNESFEFDPLKFVVPSKSDRSNFPVPLVDFLLNPPYPLEKN